MLSRLDKLISNQLGLSRSDAVKLIRSGRVTVDSEIVKKGEVKIDPDLQRVVVAGQEISYQKNVYIMMNKPKGVLSVSNDARAVTAVDLLEDESLKKRGIFPAGRLDKDSTGFLFLTDDGDFAHRMLSPRSHIEKTYIVTTDAVPANAEEAFADGVVLSDGQLCMSAVYRQISTDPPTAEIVLKEGKYHQIKRMLGTLGVGVCSLHRVKMGNLPLDETLAPGQWRKLTDAELELIMKR